MKQILLALLFVSPPSLASALITPTSQVRQVTCSAETGDSNGSQNLQDDQSASDFAAFNGAVAETLSPSEALGSGGGTQTSTINAVSMTATGSAFANAEAYEFEWFATADGRSEFDVTFSVSAEVNYDVSGMIAAFDNGGASVSLTDLGGNVIFSEGASGETPISDQGTLSFGSYRLRIVAGGSCYADDGFQLDYAFAEYDIAFTVSDPVVTASPLARDFDMSVTPNPARQATTIDYALKRDADLRLDVFDARGRRVRSLGRRSDSAGSVLWNGRDDEGDRVPGGIYFVRLRAGDQIAHRKVTILR